METSVFSSVTVPADQLVSYSIFYIMATIRLDSTIVASFNSSSRRSFIIAGILFFSFVAMP